MSDNPPAPANENDSAGSSGFLSRFLTVAAPFFTSEERWMAWLLTVGVIGLTLLQIAIAVRLNVWNRDFFNALESRDWHAFLGQMGMFALLAGSTMGVAVYHVYLKQLLQLRWRRWLTLKLVKEWLQEGRHYQLNFVDASVDNPDQRIAENARHATEMAVEFSLGILNAVVTLVSFISVLWVLSGTLEFALGGMSFAIPGYMVFAALIYAAIGSGLTYWVGNPMVAANMRTNAAEADYRFALVRLRENSEAVALIRGEADEEKGLGTYFGQVLLATMGLMRSQRRLMWLTSAYASFGMVYPTLVASPRFFAGTMTLGGLMQITAAFGQVQSSLMWFVDNYPRLAEWRAHVARLLEFENVLELTVESTTEDGEATSIVLVDCAADGGEEALRFNDLQIAHADGAIVIHDANNQIAKGEKVLIVGPSGSGKSTLFRAIAGIWPWGSGEIALPERSRMMFMPQRPYLPLGTLRAALTYPASVRKFPIATARAALERCGLKHLVDRLNETERWDRVLSGGEQQRLAFGRVLLHKPDWVFMDEATSALDEAGQADLMGLFKEELAGTSLVSIAHRAGVDAFHDRTLTLVMAAGGARLVTKRRPAAAKSAKAATKRARTPGRRSLAAVVLRRFRSAR
jgi:vitamin B12/bleomycin/antimicrobial peptide transport system ATP-binding/permease protein